MEPAYATRLACGQGEIVRRRKNSVFQVDLRIIALLRLAIVVQAHFR